MPNTTFKFTNNTNNHTYHQTTFEQTFIDRLDPLLTQDSSSTNICCFTDANTNHLDTNTTNKSICSNANQFLPTTPSEDYIVLETVDQNELAAYSVSHCAVDERCRSDPAHTDCSDQENNQDESESNSGSHDHIYKQQKTTANAVCYFFGSAARLHQRTAFARDSMWPI